LIRELLAVLPLIASNSHWVVASFNSIEMRVLSIVTILSAIAFDVSAQTPSYFPGALGILNDAAKNRSNQPDEDYVIRLERMIDREKKYLYYENVDGQVFARNQAKSETLKLNYNLFLQSMLIFEEDGDTLIMEQNPSIEFIVAGKDLFFHHPTDGFYLMKTDINEKVWLMSRKLLAIADVEVLSQNAPRSGAPLSKDRRYNVMYYHRESRRLPERIFFETVERFYLIGADKHPLVVSKRAFNRSFPGHKSQIDHFVRANAISFTNEADVRKLYQFCLQLDGSGSAKIARVDQ
jgi:hypothetical protein